MLYGALVPALQTSKSAGDTPLPPMFFIRTTSEQSGGKSDAAGMVIRRPAMLLLRIFFFFFFVESLNLADLHNRVRSSFSPSDYSDIHQLGDVRTTHSFLMALFECIVFPIC